VKIGRVRFRPALRTPFKLPRCAEGLTARFSSDLNLAGNSQLHFTVDYEPGEPKEETCDGFCELLLWL
jgi:hypothetical protein